MIVLKALECLDINSGRFFETSFVAAFGAADGCCIGEISSSLAAGRNLGVGAAFRFVTTVTVFLLCNIVFLIKGLVVVVVMLLLRTSLIPTGLF